MCVCVLHLSLVVTQAHTEAFDTQRCDSGVRRSQEEGDEQSRKKTHTYKEGKGGGFAHH